MTQPNAILVTNNAADYILLPDGTMLEPSPVSFKLFTTARDRQDDFSNWTNPRQHWTDTADSMTKAAAAIGQLVATIDADFNYTVHDTRLYHERLDFYRADRLEYHEILQYIRDTNGQTWGLGEAFEAFARRYAEAYDGEPFDSFKWQTNDDDAQPVTYYIQIRKVPTAPDEYDTFFDIRHNESY